MSQVEEGLEPTEGMGSVRVLHPSSPTLPEDVVLDEADEIADHIVARVSSDGSVVIRAPDAATLHAWLGRVLHAGNHEGHDRGAINHGDLSIDVDAHRALWQGKTLALTPQEFRLMAALTRHAGRALSFRSLMADLWGSTHLGDAPLRSTIKRLRRKLLAAGVDVVIESVRGVGYRLEAKTVPSQTALN